MTVTPVFALAFLKTTESAASLMASQVAGNSDLNTNYGWGPGGVF
jgi:hypothetical protein